MENNLIAQNLDSIQSIGLSGSKVPGDLGTFIGNVLPYVFSITAILLLIYLVMGGFQLMTSQGDPKAMQGAQAKITNALIGFVVVVFAFALVLVFGKIFGIAVFANIFK